VTHGNGCVSLRAPTGNVAPPGYYMLFLLNDKGVPSVAKFVKLQASAAAAQCDATPPPPVKQVPPVKPPTKPTQPTKPDVSPKVTRLKLSLGSFRKGRSTTISFRLNEAARVSLSVEAKLRGRRVDGRCVKPSKHKRANCSRWVKVRGGMTFSGAAGANKLTFRGKLGKRSLATGSYRLTLLAKDSGGDWSNPVSAGFKLLAAKRN
jgi:galactose oxidase-like protein